MLLDFPRWLKYCWRKKWSTDCIIVRPIIIYVTLGPAYIISGGITIPYSNSRYTSLLFLIGRIILFRDMMDVVGGVVEAVGGYPPSPPGRT